MERIRCSLQIAFQGVNHRLRDGFSKSRQKSIFAPEWKRTGAVVISPKL